jgi:hypothetical protein
MQAIIEMLNKINEKMTELGNALDSATANVKELNKKLESQNKEQK